MLNNEHQLVVNYTCLMFAAGAVFLSENRENWQTAKLKTNRKN